MLILNTVNLLLIIFFFLIASGSLFPVEVSEIDKSYEKELNFGVRLFGGIAVYMMLYCMINFYNMTFFGMVIN